METSIKHVLHINASIQEVVSQLNSIDGIRNWWTQQTNGNTEKGGEIRFNFGEEHTKLMKVIESNKNKIVWEVVECPNAPEWVGTIIRFDLSDNNGKTKVAFAHEGWKEQSEFYAHCNFSWGKYLISLRNLVETGKGEPFIPNEFQNG